MTDLRPRFDVVGGKLGGEERRGLQLRPSIVCSLQHTLQRMEGWRDAGSVAATILHRVCRRHCVAGSRYHFHSVVVAASTPVVVLGKAGFGGL